MRLDRMPARIHPYDTNERIIILDDYARRGRCDAVYEGRNDLLKPFRVYNTDEGDLNIERRCDYLLIDLINGTSRFIELKGVDAYCGNEGDNTWSIGFDQLFLTYEYYSGILEISRDKVQLILSTSAWNKTRTKYKSYTSYRRVLDHGMIIRVINPDDLPDSV